MTAALLALVAFASAGVAADAIAATGAGTGRHPAILLEAAGLPEHVVYRPQSLEHFHSRGDRLPVVVWGNGGCANAGNAQRDFLVEVASHGYLVIASGPMKPLPLPAGGNEPLSRTAQLLDAIAWAERENKRAGSPYEGRLDTRHVAAMGASCGGLQAIEAAVDPRVTTTIAWSSGLLDKPRAGANATRADLARLQGPILYVIGGPSDMAAPFADKDFAEVTQPIALANNDGAGHGGTLSQPNGGAWAPVGIAWLDWQLKGDREAAKLFTGPHCGLCERPGWSLRTRNF